MGNSQLLADDHALAMGWRTAPDRLARLKRFCDAYLLEDRLTLIQIVIHRLEALITVMQENAFNLEHLPVYPVHLHYIFEHQTRWTASLLGDRSVG